MYSSLRSASMQSKGTIPTCEVVKWDLIILGL